MITILFLAADPTDASRLRLGEEFREIDEQLRLAKQRDHFKLALPQLSLRTKDITGALLNEQPQIVHFSGHGTPKGTLCFENEIGQTHLVQPDALAALFEQFTNQVNCVILNACYSEVQAQAIAKHINYVIGMNQAIGDRAAIAFSVGFYQALGAGRSIEEAYRLGCVQIRLKNIPEHLIPVLVKRPDKYNSSAETRTGNQKALHPTKTPQKPFVGRERALRAFYSRFAYRHMKNAVYYYGGGGMGKTWLLRKILEDNQTDPLRIVPKPIDFFETDNQGIHGLQFSIRERLSASAEFRDYDAALAELEQMRADPQTEQTGALASQERRTNRLFVEACRRAAQGKDQVLLFDTFERVQGRDVGRWFLNDFVQEVRNIIIVIAGRPEPAPAAMPGNVLIYPLEGLSLEETIEYAKARPDYDAKLFTDELIQILWQASNRGLPLRLDLLFRRASHHLLREPKRLTSIEEVDKEIVKEFRSPTHLNRVLWAMAYLKRRFDMPMFQYIVAHRELLPSDLEPSDYETIFNQLGNLEFIKEYQKLRSHLLHDEVQRIFAAYLLPEVDERWNIIDPLYKRIVTQYYKEQIDKAQSSGKRELERELRAEQLGYMLDRDAPKGIERYQSYRQEIEKTRDYDLEELLWGEVYDCLKDKDKGRCYLLSLERARWLMRQSRFDRAESQYLQMLSAFRDRPDARLETTLGLGFVLLRQGEIQKAIDYFEQSRGLVEPSDSRAVAFIENNLGQAKRVAGRWDEALQHYRRALTAFASINEKLQMAWSYGNRGYIYAQKGDYDRAKQQCQQALRLLEGLPRGDVEVIRRRAYALLNMGIAYRHSQDYESAAHYFQESLRQGDLLHDLEITCHCFQNLGINACSRGRRKRWEHRSIADACTDQIEALDYITKALTIARPARWRWALGDGLSRLARVFEEIARLSRLPEARDSEDYHPLITSANAIQVPEESEFEHRMVSPDSFSEADWLGKAARLFELSALIADETSDFHRALDSEMELARLLLEKGHSTAVKRVVSHMGQMKGVTYLADLFLTMADITMADLRFDQGDYDAALQTYGEAYAKVAKQSGYATYLLTGRLRTLEERFHRLLSSKAKEVIAWCDYLTQVWTRASVSDVHPDMLDLLEAIRLDAQAY